ncbi:hypothetical protein C5167_013656, partial [Papaver somniferum]
GVKPVRETVITSGDVRLQLTGQWGSSSKYLHLSCGCLQFVFNVTTFMQGASLRLIFFYGGSKEIWEAKFITLKSLELNFQSDIIGCWEGLSVSSNQLQAVKIWKMIWIIATTRIGMLNAMVKAIGGLCSFIHLEDSTLRSKHSAALVVLIQSSQVKEIEGTPLLEEDSLKALLRLLRLAQILPNSKASCMTASSQSSKILPHCLNFHTDCYDENYYPGLSSVQTDPIATTLASSISRVNVIGSISNLLYNGKEPVFPTCFTVPKGLELDIRASEQKGLARRQRYILVINARILAINTRRISFHAE